MKTVLTCLLVLMALVSAAPAVEKIDPDPKAVALINDFLKALAIPDEAERLKAVMPLLNKSMYSNDGRDLDPQVKQFSYKKASGAVNLYAFPAVITEVHKGNVQQIGFKQTAQQGRIDKYFVAKKEGVQGRPAPLHVFWPADGGAPTLVNIGSL